jgi:hypothetical protein
MLAFAE